MKKLVLEIDLTHPDYPAESNLVSGSQIATTLEAVANRVDNYDMASGESGVIFANSERTPVGSWKIVG